MIRMLSKGHKMNLAGDVVSSELGDGVALLDLRGGVYYGLNPVGARVWRLLEEKPRNFFEIREVLLDEYDVSPDVCERELELLLWDLLERRLIYVEDESRV